MPHCLDWITPCYLPLPINPCGEDPYFDDRFEHIKLEIEKLGGCDYTFIIEQSHALLTTTTKDLRVAGYLCLALVQQHQLEGLLTGLALLHALISRFGKDLHPQNPRARLSSFHWLNTPRFARLLEGVSAGTQTKAVTQAIEDLNAIIASAFNGTCPAFNALDTWLAQQHPPTCTNATINEKTPVMVQEMDSIASLLEDLDALERLHRQLRKKIEHYLGK